MTKGKTAVFVMAVCSTSGIAVAADRSSDRVETIRFEIADPTVAPEDVLARGVALEYWYIDSNTDPRADTISKGALPGISAWVGRNRWSFNLHGRAGKIDGSVSDGFEEDQSLVEGEFSIRRKFAVDGEGVYILAGMIYQERRIEDTYHDPLFGGTIEYSRNYVAPMVGVGAIINFSSRWSMRDDLKIAYGKLRVSGGDPFDEGGDYYNYSGSITLAFRVSQQIALQGGFKIGSKGRSLSNREVLDKDTGWMMSAGYVF